MTGGLIILEGANGTGKTTLAQEIAKQSANFEYFHAKHRFGDRMWDFHAALLESALDQVNLGKIVVLDRLWLSEDVYGQVYRGGTQIPLQGRILQKVLMKVAATTVVCLAPPDVALEQVEVHRKSYHSPHLVQKPAAVALRYSHLWNGECQNKSTYAENVPGGLKSVPGFVKYYFKEEGADMPGFVSRLLSDLEAKRLEIPESWRSVRERNIAGSWTHGKFVLVGEKANSGGDRTWPFFEHRNSSLFLESCLEDIGVRAEHVVWTNAEGDGNFIPFLHMRFGSRFIALGKQASSALRDERIIVPKNQHLPHPSFGMRFTDKSSYSRALKSAVESALR